MVELDNCSRRSFDEKGETDVKNVNYDQFDDGLINLVRQQLNLVEAVKLLRIRSIDRISTLKHLMAAFPELTLGEANAALYLSGVWDDRFLHSDQQKKKMTESLLRRFPSIVNRLQQYQKFPKE